MSAGFHGANRVTVPFLTNSRIWVGVPRPVNATLPLEPDELMQRAAAAMPTVVGDAITLRFGYDGNRPRVSWNDFRSSSLPWAVVNSFSQEFSD